MANGGKITFGVGFDVDQSGLEKLKIQLNELKKMSPSQLLEINPDLGNINQAKKEIAEIRKTISGVDIALDKAFNTDLGVLNVQKFSQSLKSMGINNVAQSFSKMGAAGVQAFNELATKALTVNIQLKETKSIFDKMGETLINTLKWNISSSTINALSNSVQQAWGYAKHLDSSLNDIRIVTGKSADEMTRFAEQANQAAKKLGSSTTDYTEAALIYYQQGLSDEEAAARAETTVKAANVTGQSGEAVSEQLTAVWNGYKVSAEEAELYIDKLAAVAATTASDLEELSTGMSKVASAAAIMGVDIDQLNAQLATIVSVTREAPESIGTALKTVYARMSDIKAGLDGEVTLDEYTQQMLDMGINVLDAEGNLRDMGDVIEEIGGKWQSMTREQQTSLAQTIAGTRQYSRMMALFDNWGMYTEALNTSATAAGTLNEQNEIYLESTEAHLTRLKTAQEGLFDSLIDTKGINELIDTFTKVIEKTEVFIDAIGGGKGALLGLSAVLPRVFSKQIAQQIEPMITGMQSAKHNAQALQQVLTNINNFSAKEGFSSAAADAMKKAQLQLSQYWNVMSTEEINQSQKTVEEIGKITQLTEEWKSATAAVKEYVLANANQTNQKTLQNKDFSNLTTYEDKAVQQTLNTTKNKIDELSQAYKNLETARSAAAKANQSGSEEKKTEAYKNMANAIQEVINKIQNMPDSVTNQKEVQKLTELKTTLEKYANSTEKTTVSTKDMDKAIKEAGKAVEDAEKKYKKTTDAIQQQREAQEKLNKANADLKMPELDTRYIVQNLSNVISGFSSLAFTINSISSIGDILADDDLSSWEKATRIMMSLGTVAMSVSGIFKGFSAVTNLVTMASIRNAAAIEAETVAENQNIFSKVKNTIVTKTAAGSKNILALAELNLEQAVAKGVIAEEAANIARTKGIASLGAETVAKIAAVGGTQAMTGAVIKDTIATLANAAAKTLLNPTILLVAGSVALLTGVIYGAVKAFNAEEDAAKKAAKTHEETKKNYDSIKQSYENIKSSLDSYQSARDALSEMTAGTEEWKNAVFELNNQVSELIQKYPELAKYMTTNSQGMLEISQEGMDWLRAESQNDMYEAAAASARAASVKSQADYNLKTKDSQYIDTYGTESLENKGYSTTSSSSIIDFAEGYGGIEKLIGTLQSNNPSSEYIATALSEITGLTEMTAQNWGDFLSSNLESLTSLEDALHSNEEVILANNKIIAKGILQDKETYQQLSENGKIIAEEVGAQQLTSSEVQTNVSKGDIQKFQKENQDLLDEYGYGTFLKGTNDESDAKLVLDALGIDYQSISEAGGNTFKYIDSEGQTQTIDYSDYYDQVLAYLSDIADGEKTEEDIEKYNTAMSQLTETYGKENADMLETYMATGSLTGYTDEQIKAFQESGIIEATWDTFNSQWANVSENPYASMISSMDINKAVTDALNRENKVDVFKNENAQSIATSATNLLESGQYLTPEIVAQNADYDNLVKNAELIKELYPSIAADMDMINQSQKAGSEDWLKSLENVQAYMGAIAEDADSIWTKEDAEQYGTTTDDLDIALAQGDIDQATYDQKFQGSFEYETEALDLDTEAVLEHADALQDMALAEEDVADALAKDDKAAKKVAKMHAQMNKGVEALAENYEDIAEILSDDTQKSTSEYLGALDDLRDIMGDVLTMDADQLSEGFLTSAENMELMKLAAQGDTDAIDQLRVAASNDIILQAIGKSDFTSLDQELQDEIAYVNQLAADNDFEIGAKLDNTDFLNACMDIVNQAGMTAEEATNYLASMGIDATVTEVPADTVAEHTWVSPEVTKLPGGYYAVTGTKKVTARDTTKGGAGFALEVSNATYGGRSGGGVNKKSSGGGGGGGGGSSKAPDRASYIEDEPDRYHDVNIELAELATAYDRLGKAQEKLTSGDLINNLNEQLEVLQKQILTYKEKLKLMEEEKSELQGELGAQGVQFSEDGSISNYNDALINRLNQANAEIDRYNQMTAEQQEATKDTDGKTLADRATEDYEEFKEALDRYDTLTSEEIPELQDSIQDAIDQQIEIQIQKFNMGIEVQLDMAEATKEFNEWKAKVIDGLKDDDLLGNTKLTMENMQIYFDPSQGEGLMTQTASHLQQVMDEIAVMQSGGTSDIYGDNMAAAMEDLTKYQEELMNQTTEWADYVQEVQDNYLDMIDEANDKIDEQRENYEFINNQLEHSLSIIEKMHGDGAYEEMAQIYELQRQSYEEQLSFQRQEVELWAQRMEEARLSGDTEALEKYTENWKDAQEELDSLVEAALDNLLTEYENAVNLAFDKLNEKVTGGMGLDYVSEEWELANQNAEMYLDTINEAFAIDQLRNKYQKSINETSNLDTQKKLNDLMEKEITALEKKDKLTQYDVERANMKYDIALKQIALEEAQQNKTTMRLKRDSQGNYTYQYTSDDDAVADAQQQLAEAQNSLYNFDKENYQNNLDQMLSVYTEFQQKMAEAALINDEEQRQARMLMLQEQYGQLINGITAENEVIRYNLHESAFDELATNVYGKNVEEFYNMSQEEQNEIMSGLVPTWEGGVQQMADAFSDGFLPTCQDTFDQIDVGYEELKAGMSAVAEQAGIDFQTYADGTQPAIDKMKELVQDNKDVVTEMGNQLSSMQALRDQALEMDDAYKPYLNTIEDLVGKSQNLRQAEADVTTELSKQKTTLDQLTVSFTSAIAKLKEYNNTPVQPKDTGGGGGNGNTGGYSGGLDTTTKDTPKERWGVFGQKSNKRVAGPFSTKGDADREATAQQGKNKWFNGQNRQWEIEGLLVKQYDTGGYTGEWAGGSKKENGRLALLHQKELVLNEQDTSNFLTAIQITRGMSGVLESVANKMASIGSTFSSNVANTSNGIQQQITINADFPDATSATEIEEALLSLVNRASQQAFNVNI